MKLSDHATLTTFAFFPPKLLEPIDELDGFTNNNRFDTNSSFFPFIIRRTSVGVVARDLRNLDEADRIEQTAIAPTRLNSTSQLNFLTGCSTWYFTQDNLRLPN